MSGHADLPGPVQGRPRFTGAAVAVAAALAVYAVAGAPAPPSPGPAEAAVGLLLVLAVGIARPLWLGTGYLLRDPALLPVEAAACLAVMLAVWPGILTGLAQGWTYTDMVRDLMPFAFLFLPVLIRCRTPGETARLLDVAAWGLAFVGLVYALRWWIDLDVSLRTIGAAALIEQPPFLLKSASLPFAAVWLAAQGFRRIGLRVGPVSLVVGLTMIVASVVCLGALAGAVHRAGVLLAGSAILVVLVRRFGGSAGAWLLTGGIVTALYLTWGEAVTGSAHLAMEKTRTVGVNNRMAEFAAVLRQLADSPWSFLFGQGWGSLIRSPAVGELPISYTHNIASYVLLKTGAVGLIGVAAYLAAILARTGTAWVRRPDLVLALAPSLLIGLLLHTSYKYMCFGFVLLLLKLASDHGVVRKD